jgi:hypothetical protein
MTKPKKRDNAYWLARLERYHPAVFAKLRARKIKSVRQACAEAGLIHLPSRVDALMREWRAASNGERNEFVKRAKAAGGATPKPVLAVPLTGTDGRLTSTAVKDITAARLARGLKVGGVSKALGYNPLDPRLGFALRRRWVPTPDFFHALEKWLRS